jgi:hypothetical protein
LAEAAVVEIRFRLTGDDVDTCARQHWWAREDSNLQPDRYERSALTS